MSVLSTRTNGQTITAPWFNSIKTLIDNDLVLTPLSVTADKTLGTDANVISASSLSGAVDLDLPALADNDKKYYILKATDLTNGVTVNPDGSDTIDGDASYAFSNVDEAIAVVGDATNDNWVIVSSAFDSTGGSGGAGSASIYALIKPESNLVAEWNTTNLSNASMGLDSADPLAGDSSYELTNATSAGTEFIISPNVEVPLRSRGKTSGINFPYLYDGDDDDISVSIYDVTNSATLETLSLDAASVSTTGSIVPYIPTSCEEIQFRATIDVANNGKLFVFDDIEFSDDPFTYQNLLDQEGAIFNTVTGYGSTNNKIPYYSNEVSNDTGSIITIANSAVNGLSITANKECVVYLGVTGAFGAAGNVGISLNSTELTTGISSLTVADRLVIGTTSAAGYFDDVSVSIKMSAADVLRPHFDGGALSSTDTHHVSISATSETAAVVHSSTGTENTFSANISASGGTPSVEQSSIDFIASITDNGVGDYTINFVTGLFSVAPSVVGNVSDASNHVRILNVNSVSTSSVSIRIFDGSNAARDEDFFIMAQRQGTDYKNPSAYAVTPLTQTCYIKDVKASGTAGGTFTSGAWQTRDLNTLEGDISWCSLATNQFTLPAGKYEISAKSPALDVDGHQSRLYSVSGSAAITYGTSEYAGADLSSISSCIETTIDISEATTYRIEHYGQTTQATNGFGSGNSFGNDQIFAQVKITKLTWE